jgi:hypothetical protein
MNSAVARCRCDGLLAIPDPFQGQWRRFVAPAFGKDGKTKRNRSVQWAGRSAYWCHEPMNVAGLSFFPDPLHSRRRPAWLARACAWRFRVLVDAAVVAPSDVTSEPLRRASRGSLRRTCFLRLGFCMRGQVVGVSLREFLLWTGLEESRAQQLRCSRSTLAVPDGGKTGGNGGSLSLAFGYKIMGTPSRSKREIRARTRGRSR